MENINLRDSQIIIKGMAIIWWALANLDPPHQAAEIGNYIELVGIIARLEQEDPNRVLPIGFANPHSYRGNYHVWETLVRGDEPDAYGIAMKRVDCKEYKSDFNSKLRIRQALAEIHALLAGGDAGPVVGEAPCRSYGVHDGCGGECGEAFGFVEDESARHTDEEGTITHAELSLELEGAGQRLDQQSTQTGRPTMRKIAHICIATSFALPSAAACFTSTRFDATPINRLARDPERSSPVHDGNPSVAAGGERNRTSAATAAPAWSVIIPQGCEFWAMIRSPMPPQNPKKTRSRHERRNPRRREGEAARPVVLAGR